MFIFLELAVLSFIIGYIGLLSDKKQTNPDWAIVIACVFSAFAFLPSKDIFSTETAVTIWKVSSSLCVLITTIVLLFDSTVKIRLRNHLFGLIGAIAVGGLPFWFNISNPSIYNENIEVFFVGKPYIEILIILSLIIACVFAIFFYALTHIKNQKRTIEQQQLILYRLDEINIDEVKNFRMPYEKLVREELSHLISKFDREYFNLSKYINKTRHENIGETNVYDNTNEIKKIQQDIDEIKRLVFSSNKPDNIDKSDIVRELNHFLATPFSSIIANVEIIKASKGNLTNINKHLDRIIKSVELCKCVMTTYKEASIIRGSDNSIVESFNDMCHRAFEMYSDAENKKTLELKVNNIPNIIDGFSNHYLLCLMLPLIQNAICASPEKSVVFISYNSDLKLFTIENECTSVPEIDNLNKLGYSSKNGHRGTGIMIAKGLLNSRNLGELSFEIKNSVVIQKIKLE